MNVPGIAAGNWQWRVEENQLTEKLAMGLRKESQTFNRGNTYQNIKPLVT